MSTESAAAMAQSSELVITRDFAAPRARVFRAFTDGEYLRRWWAPKDFTCTYATVDLRSGGMFHFCMRSAEGQDIWGRGIYREILRPARLVYVDSFSDATGKLVPPSHYGMSNMPDETLVTLSFDEHAGGTRLTLRGEGLTDPKLREQTHKGWNEMFDRLAGELARDQG